jgi:hypothetical protein
VPQSKARPDGILGGKGSADPAAAEGLKQSAGPGVYLNAGPEQGRLRVDREAKKNVSSDYAGQDERRDVGRVVARGEANSDLPAGSTAGGGASAAPAYRAPETQADKPVAPQMAQAPASRPAAVQPVPPVEEGRVTAAPPAKDAQANDAQATMQRANELADAGKCDEAAKLYKYLESRYPSAWTPQVGLHVARCLRQQQRLDEEQGILDQIKRQKAPINSDLANEQRLLDERRAHASATSGAAGTRAKSKKGSKTAVDSEGPAPSSTAIKRAY